MWGKGRGTVPIELTHHTSAVDMTVNYVAKGEYSGAHGRACGYSNVPANLREGSRTIRVAENFPQIAAKLDQNAIANLAIAEASKKIAEEIPAQAKLVVHEVEKQIFQRGIFGGVRRRFLR